MILQLNPPLPVLTPLGTGFAIAVIDYYAVSMNTVWVVALTAGGQFKHFLSEQVRLAPDKMHGVGDASQKVPTDSEIIEMLARHGTKIG